MTLLSAETLMLWCHELDFHALIRYLMALLVVVDGVRRCHKRIFYGLLTNACPMFLLACVHAWERMVNYESLRTTVRVDKGCLI